MMRRCLPLLAVLIACSEEPPADDGMPSDESSEAGGGHPGCAEGEPDQIYRADMVGCPGHATQCTAAELCAEGWHLCRTHDFEMRGGLDTPATEQRWLAACVREAGAGPTCPTAGTCNSDCATTVSGVEAAVSFGCNTAVLTETGISPLGVATSTDAAAHRVGCVGALCMFYDAAQTNTPLGATCCRD